jgi:hypothetical protein
MSSDLLAAHRHTSKNRREIEASTVCGCFYCMQVFSPDEVVAFTGLDEINLDDPAAIDAETAVCPRCGSESVIGNKSGYDISPQFLSRMHDAWFQKTIIRKPGR